jgi:hypothetical protein
MAITQITRMWANQPSIVSIVTTDTLFTITQNGYLTSQAANIAALNNGAFQWQLGDYALIYYAGGEGFFTVDYLTNLTFVAATQEKSINITVTSAQIQALYATPLLIIPAQGAHTWIVCTNSIYEFDYGTTQYTAGGAFGLQYDSTVHAGGTAASATLAAATINGFTANNGFTLAGAATGTMASMVNKGIYLCNATAAFATGDSTITATIPYKVINTTA